MIVISGSHGLIGSALVKALAERGHEVRRLVRSAPRSADEIAWNPDAGTIDSAALRGASVVVNLAGENIAQRWTRSAKRRIHGSRVQGTTLVARTIAALPDKPSLLVNASAVGIYGDRGDEALDERSAPGAGFLATVCRDWEAATAPASDAGIRVAMLRTGVVLARGDGALPKLLLPFRLGLGGRIGSGRQWVSWIALGDVVRAVLH
ncbi:MAG: TIGR01777 family oxidoreductase, partial [Gemmatimonadaceae bacterium]